MAETQRAPASGLGLSSDGRSMARTAKVWWHPSATSNLNGGLWHLHLCKACSGFTSTASSEALNCKISKNFRWPSRGMLQGQSKSQAIQTVPWRKERICASTEEGAASETVAVNEAPTSPALRSTTCAFASSGSGASEAVALLCVSAATISGVVSARSPSLEICCVSGTCRLTAASFSGAFSAFSRSLRFRVSLFWYRRDLLAASAAVGFDTGSMSLSALSTLSMSCSELVEGSANHWRRLSVASSTSSNRSCKCATFGSATSRKLLSLAGLVAAACAEVASAWRLFFICLVCEANSCTSPSIRVRSKSLAA
mmetsp:Transcript_12025/g.28478  ORF Transcript_12025/g.28478 Transcript_12025/m.28478 type:complete len:312 (-) Transcript_12025:1018-1953(-)